MWYCDYVKEDTIASHILGEWVTNTDGTQNAKCTVDGCGYIEKRDSNVNNNPSDDNNNNDDNNNDNNNNNDDNNDNNNNNNNNNNSNDNNNNNSNNNKNTVNGKIPYAGSESIMGLIALIAIGGIISYIKFKKSY